MKILSYFFIGLYRTVLRNYNSINGNLCVIENIFEKKSLHFKIK